MKETPISKNTLRKTAKRPRSVSLVPKIVAKTITLSQPTIQPALTTEQHIQSKDFYVRRTSLMITEAVSEILMRPLHDPFKEPSMKVTLDEVYLGSKNLYRLSTSNALTLWTEIELTLRITIRWRLEIISQYADSSYNVETCAIFVYGLREACISIEKDLKMLSLVLSPIDHFLSGRKTESIYQAGMSMIEQELTREPAYSCIRRSVAILFQGVRDGHCLTSVSNTLLSMVRKFSQKIFKSLRNYTIDVLRMYINHVLIPLLEQESLSVFLNHLVTQFERFSQFLKVLRPANAAIFVNLDRLILDFGLRYNLDAIWSMTKELIYSPNDPPASKLSYAARNCLNMPDIFGGIPSFLEDEILDLFGDSTHSRQRRNISSLIWNYNCLWHLLLDFARSHWWEDIQSELSHMIRVNWAKAISKDPEFEEILIEGLAKYAHRELKQYRSMYDPTDGTTRHEIMQGFRALGGKDIFMIFYKRDLARRLLSNMSLELDEEENRYIDEMTWECGSAFTQDIATMTEDIDSSIDLSIRFFEGQAPSPEGIVFTAKILTTGKWPEEPSKRAVPLPADFSSYKERFTEFYNTEHPRRKLTWAPSLDLVVIKASFTSGPRKLLMNLFQALIILLFNKDPSNNGLTYSQISKAVRFAKEDLNPALHSLVMGRVKLLTITTTDKKRDQRKSKIEEFQMDDRFQVLTDISTKSYQIKLHGYKVGGAYGSRKREAYDGLREQLKRNRNLEVQAAIVRIMKRRGKLSIAHEMLFVLVQEETKNRGQITKSEFKHALEEVMASGNPYVGRDAKDPSSFVYLY